MAISQDIQQLVANSLVELKIPAPADIHLEHPADPSHGDYATNVAMQVFGASKNTPDFTFSNPRELASALVEVLQQSAGSDIAKIEVAGPGFINFTLSDNFLLDSMQSVITQKELLAPSLDGQKIVVEFTDPNPFKQLHIGHLYSNTVGESVCKMFEALGAEVKRADYFGDVGMHVAKSVWGMKKKLQEENLTLEQLEEQPLSERVAFLGQAYALGATAYKDDEQAQAEIKEINYLTYKSGQENLVESKNWQPQINYDALITTDTFDYSEIKQLYQTGRAWSLAYFDSIYQRVGMQFDYYYPESETGEYGTKIVREYLKKGVFEESDGAIVYKGEKHGLHTRVFLNSFGLPTYEAKELGLPGLKFQDFPYDRSFIITGNEINEYFKVLLAAISEVNPDLATKTTHIGHGMVRLPEGKMSSRTGQVITAEWLLDEAAQRIEEHLRESQPKMSEAEQMQLADAIGQAAIKYAFLKQAIGADIAFSFDESLSFTGNSGPYLQYTVVRCKSILEKAGATATTDLSPKLELSPSERALLRLLYRYPEAVTLAAQDLAPHHVCTYLFELAQAFNTFYAHCPVVSETDQDLKQLRLALTSATSRIIESGLALLGIRTVSVM